MKIRYIYPDTFVLTLTQAALLAQSQSSSVDASGQDFGDPVTVSDSDFNNIF